MPLNVMLANAVREHRAGKLSEALELYDDLLRQVPGNPVVLHYRGVALYQRGDLDAAEASIRKALAANGNDFEAWNNLGNVIQQQGRVEEAIAAFRKAIALSPQFFGAHYNLGNALERCDCLAEAELAFREVVRLKPDHARAHNNLGLVLKRQGKSAAATQAFRRAFAADPAYVDPLANLGLVLMMRKDWSGAVETFRQLVALRPEDAGALANLAASLSALGPEHNAEAEALCRHAIECNPQSFEPHNALCIILQSTKREESAVAAGRRAVALNPAHPSARLNLGAVLLKLERHGEAAEQLEQAVRQDPDNAEAHSWLGGAYRGLKRLEDSEAESRRALALDPNLANAHANLGIVLLEFGRVDEAIAAIKQACALKPDSADYLSNLGFAYHASRQYEKAIATWKKAASLDPDHADSFLNLAIAFIQTRRFEEAVAACRRAIALKPERGDCHANLALALVETKETKEAVAAARRAVALAPDNEATWNALGCALAAEFDVEGAIVAYRRAIEVAPDSALAHKNLAVGLGAKGLLVEGVEALEVATRVAPGDAVILKDLLCYVSYIDHLTNADYEGILRRAAERFVRTVEPLPPPAWHREAGSKIRVAYLSSDFRYHPVAGSMLPSLRHSDRSRFELHLYSVTTKVDAETDRFSALADGWHDMRYRTDREIAEQIRADGIDILVTLAARFDDNRPGICCYRPAPVQISMHDVGTSALPMDYIVGDRWLMPRGSSEYFSERCLRLPHWYVGVFPNDLIELRETTAGDAPVFGCFNNPGKITTEVLRLWGKILAAMPESKLLLHYLDRYKYPEIRERMTSCLVENGARLEQIDFKVEATSREDFLGLHNEIDLALDPFPFSGSTTSFQALCMGVPIVTWPWERMASAWTAAMLHPLGLGDLVAGSAGAYVDIAVATARAAPAWRRRRREISRGMADSPLCDPAQWMRSTERLYHAVWRRYCARKGGPDAD